MNIRLTPLMCTALLLVLSAGTAAPAVGQTPTKTARNSAAVASTVDFRSSKWMSDRSVVNNNGEDIANVSDLILDRGTGRIEYVVVKTGTTFGMGGRAITVPFGAFAWEAAGGKDRFILAQTIEQLKQYAEYTPEGWKALKEPMKDDKSMLRQRLDADGISASDPYAGHLDTAKQATVTGEITNVERIRTSKFGEQVQILVQTPEGSKKITLGPSWYVNGSSAAPMRGDKAIVDTLALPRDADSLLAATHIRIGKNELHLRETDGSPAWALKQVDSAGRMYSSLYSRYLLLSDLPGIKIDCRGSDCGKVYDIILDRTSGEIGFLSVDPNQNFLGIGDTKRMVPWSIALVMLDGTMRIDASKDMVLASPETPSDLSELNTGTHAERVYKAFGVAAPKFEMRKSPDLNPLQWSAAWAARGTVLSAIEPGSAKTIDGTIIDITDVSFGKDIQSARALKIRTGGESGPEELVILGPVWYMDNQKAMYKSGESITVEACRTTIEGRKYWIARSLACKDKSIVLLDSSDSPSWSKP